MLTITSYIAPGLALSVSSATQIPLDADRELTAAQNGLAAPAEAVPDRLFEHGLVPCSPFGGNVFG